MANDYFTGDRLFWDDGDFTTLEQKATYAMLWQSVTTDIAGIHTRNDNLDSARVCLPLKKFKSVIVELEKMGKIKTYNNLIWVKSAIWRNLYKGKCSKDQYNAVEKRLTGLGGHPVVSDIREWYEGRYSLSLLKDHPPPTHPQGSRTVTVSVTEAETVSEPEGSLRADALAPIMQSWNLFAEANGLSKINSITEKRKRSIRARLVQDGFLEQSIYEKIKESKFLLGDNDRGWRCDFDFVWGSPDNWVKITEGKYGNTNKSDRAQAEIDAWIKAKQNA